MTNERKGDCYAGGERRFMEWGQKLRGEILSPILKILLELNITANHLTFLSLIAGLGAALAFKFSILLGLFLLLLHVLLDGLDGPLARYSNTASNRGSFTDTAADQLVILAIMLVLVNLKIAEPEAALIYVTAYTTVVGFAIIRNTLDIPYSWLVRPRFLIYAWLVVEFWIFPQTLNIVIWACDLLLLWKVGTGFWKIRYKL